MKRIFLGISLAAIGALLITLGAVLATDAIEKYTGTTPIEPGSPFCFEVGKSSELGGDCFCVEEELDSVAELDCLVESRVIPASEYEMFLNDPSFRKKAGLSELEPQSQAPTLSDAPTQVVLPFCSAVGKESQIAGDCFCVEGSIDTIDELDCMIESGLIPREQYETYREQMTKGN